MHDTSGENMAYELIGLLSLIESAPSLESIRDLLKMAGDAQLEGLPVVRRHCLANENEIVRRAYAGSAIVTGADVIKLLKDPSPSVQLAASTKLELLESMGDPELANTYRRLRGSKVPGVRANFAESGLLRVSDVLYLLQDGDEYVVSSVAEAIPFIVNGSPEDIREAQRICMASDSLAVRQQYAKSPFVKPEDLRPLMESKVVEVQEAASYNLGEASELPEEERAILRRIAAGHWSECVRENYYFSSLCPLEEALSAFKTDRFSSVRHAIYNRGDFPPRNAFTPVECIFIGLDLSQSIWAEDQQNADRFLEYGLLLSGLDAENDLLPLREAFLNLRFSDIFKVLDAYAHSPNKGLPGELNLALVYSTL